MNTSAISEDTMCAIDRECRIAFSVSTFNRRVFMGDFIFHLMSIPTKCIDQSMVLIGINTRWQSFQNENIKLHPRML